ncbi:MAG: BON domain-containing protein [Pirellulaceae bacterium]|nr:BON domain-containing protein [Pirellulaceae bacterium]
MARCADKPWLVAVGLLTLGVLGFASDGYAQLFGERSVGRPVARRPGAASAQNGAGATGPALESIGVMVDESARYVRGNRAVTDFVGSDTAEASRFVGSLQAGAGEVVQSAIDENLQIETGVEVNQVIAPVIPARMRLNAPRLELGFAVRPPAADVLHVTVLRRLQTSLPGLDPDLVVSVADGVATLRGTVASERDRKMAAMLVAFEPGIGRVQNELAVANPAVPTPEGLGSGSRPTGDGLR